MLSVGTTYSVVLPHTSCHTTKHFCHTTRVNISTGVTVPVTVTESTVHSDASCYTYTYAWVLFFPMFSKSVWTLFLDY